MTTTDTTVSNLIINKLTQAQYEAITTPSDTELYLTTDSAITSTDVTTALGYTPQAELVSGTSIKTVNSNSLLGSGNISISDTKNTAGSSNASYKLYLVGAQNQSTNAITYSKSTVYANTDGTLNCVTPASTKNDTTVATTKWVKDLGYTTNTGTVTSVNNVQPVNGNVTLSIPAAQVQADWDVTDTTSKAFIKNKPYIPSGVVVDQTYDPTSTNAQSGVAINGAGFLTGINSTMVTNALGYTPYSSANPNNYTSVVESTVSGWGFTKNAGTVTSVNNVSPVNGNITLSIPTVDQTYNSTSANAQSGVAIAGAKFLKNKSTNTAGTSYIIGGTASGVSNAVCVGSGASTSAYSVVVGQGASSTALYSTAIGSTADSNSQFGTAIGYAAKARATSAIQLGTGTNTDSNTLSIGFSDAATNYQLLDGTTGLIPDARLSTNIQRTLVSGTSIKTINSTSLLGSGNIAVLQNSASGSNAISIGQSTNRDNIVTIGVSASANTGGIAIGYDANVSLSGVAIGNGAESANGIAIGNGAQSTLSDFAVALNNTNYILLDGSTGIIPDARLNNLKFDGQWVGVTATLCQSRTSETGNDKSFDVSAYLPSDSNNYEVLLTGAVTTGTTSGNQARINLTSSIINDKIVICNAQTRTSSGVTAYGSCTLPIGTDREVIVQGWANNTGAYSLYLRGYRRIGTNS